MFFFYNYYKNYLRRSKRILLFKKIYLNVEAKMRIVVPFHSDEIEVTTQIPVSDTIIVGKIPDTAINMNGSN